MVNSDTLYSPLQQKVLTYTPVVTGPLSVFGSSFVVYDILADRRNKLKKTYHRILLGLSIMDSISSAGIVAFSSWAVPKDTPGVYGAQGNTATCDASGFFLHLNMSTALYTSLLSYFYVLVIRSRKSEKWIASYAEPIIHSVSILVPLITGAVALAMGFFNPLVVVAGWCWIIDFPANCSSTDEAECERGGNYKTFSRIAALGTFAFAWCFIVVDMVLIFLTVRTTEKRLQQYAGDSAMRRTKETGVQALLYIGSFFATYIALAIIQLVPMDETASNRSYFFGLAFVGKFFMPLQGFWNALIYFRGRRRNTTQRRAKSLASLLSSSALVTSRLFRQSKRKDPSAATSKISDSTLKKEPNQNVVDTPIR